MGLISDMSLSELYESCVNFLFFSEDHCRRQGELYLQCLVEVGGIVN